MFSKCFRLLQFTCTRPINFEAHIPCTESSRSLRDHPADLLEQRLLVVTGQATERCYIVLLEGGLCRGEERRKREREQFFVKSDTHDITDLYFIVHH